MRYLTRFTAGLLVLLLLFVFVRSEGVVQASQFENRSLRIGSSRANAVTNYTIRFDYPGTTPIGSVLFEFCDTPLFALSCGPVPGIDVSSAVLSGQTGTTGFSVLSTTPTSVILTRPISAATAGAATYTLSNVTNPSSNGTFYMRLSSYATTNATGPRADEGGTAAALTSGLSTTLFVPPVLIFCVDADFTALSCNSGTGSLVDLGQLRTDVPNVGTSEMMIATNAGDGYVITVSGGTMSAGTKTIPELAVPTLSAPGNSQFGMNLVSNTSPGVGSNPVGPGFNGTIAGRYANQNLFSYQDNDILVTNTTVTDYKLYTSSYLVNVSPTQSAGFYATTLTYTATANF